MTTAMVMDTKGLGTTMAAAVSSAVSKVSSMGMEDLMIQDRGTIKVFRVFETQGNLRTSSKEI